MWAGCDLRSDRQKKPNILRNVAPFKLKKAWESRHLSSLSKNGGGLEFSSRVEVLACKGKAPGETGGLSCLLFLLWLVLLMFIIRVSVKFPGKP